MSFETLLYRVDPPLGLITLNRPDKLNAINAAMVRELHKALDAAEADPKVRVIVLNGAGRAFSAGFDLGLDDGAAPLDIDVLRRQLREDFDIIMRFWDSPKTTIAAVHTYCLGSAMEMAVACDITVAATSCRFGAPEVKFGSGIVALILPWLIGVKAAKELLLTGDDRVSAERALALGLVNRVVSDEDYLAEAHALARNIAVNDPLAVQITKRAINQTFEIMGMKSALLQALELDVVVEACETPQSREFNEILRTRGTKAAIEWRDARLRRGDADD